MFLHNVPSELFDIASSFTDSEFRVDSVGLLELNEFQIRIELKIEEDVAIYARFVRGKETIISFGEAYAGTYSEDLKWTSRDEIIQKFSDWYYESFGFRYYEPQPEIV